MGERCETISGGRIRSCFLFDLSNPEPQPEQEVLLLLIDTTTKRHTMEHIE